ncbi:ABSCISIC ACID-INSENSITIVE 5-like protein 8 [Cardamine amara subsp. amara]|uniref:ABSCISIC ACID-INSENSITIVE 5-like protein 8 n=1 Tax=Cardamine amara subsp. amara TaxID=228776 RepID=A0ABD0ZVQ1_CARAN
MDSNWNLTTLGNGLSVSTLSRQDSIYSWTVDQFQHSLGKDCGSMNMNELVKNISSAQGTQKTVDEVWKYITEEEHTNDHGGGTRIPQIQSQQTLGEITLQEFLIRAGVKGNNKNGGYIHDTSLGVHEYHCINIKQWFQGVMTLLCITM